MAGPDSLFATLVKCSPIITHISLLPQSLSIFCSQTFHISVYSGCLQKNKPTLLPFTLLHINHSVCSEPGNYLL